MSYDFLNNYWRIDGTTYLLSVTSGSPSLIIENTVNDAKINFINGDGTTGSLQYDNGSDGFEFRTNGTAATDTKFYIGDDGDVGIGTTTPTANLHINNVEDFGINITGNTSAFVGCDICVQRSSTASGVGKGATLQFGDLGTGDANIIQSSPNGLQFLNNYNSSGWTEKMVITPDGKVGIGFSTLGVGQGTLRVKGAVVAESGASIGNAFIADRPATTGYAAFQIRTGGTDVWAAGVRANETHFGIYDEVATVDRLSILTNGNVGIGTTTPDEKLTVAGNIHAQEVKVTIGAGTGPDYVFEPDYNLKSLESIEKFIKSNNHLPEIPSAKEMEANGVQLGEMNMLLLKKIEELTLYQIELMKMIKNQQSEIDELKKN